MHFVLFYDYVPDFMERRAPFRNSHLALAWEYQERGELIMAGVLDEPADGAMFLFKAESRKTVEAFVAADSYVANGIVSGWKIRPWNTVVGKDATNPVRPS